MFARRTFKASNLETNPEQTFKTLVSEALSNRCGKKVDKYLAEIGLSDTELKTKADAILNIALKRQELPHVVIRCFTELELLGQSWVRILISDVIKKQEDPDMDHVRGQALASLVKIKDLSLDEVALLAKSINHSSRNISYKIADEIKQLGKKQLARLHKQALLLNPTLVPEVVVLIKKLESAKIRAVGISEETENSYLSPRALKVTHKPPCTESINQTIKLVPVSAQPKHNSGMARIIPIAKKAIDVKSSQLLKLQPITTELAVQETPLQQVNPEPAVSAIIEPAPSALRQLAINLLLEDLLDPSLSKKTLSELLWIKSETKEPIAICNCIAEITTRFGLDAGRDNGSDQLVWIISDPAETPAKEMARVLTHALFSESLNAPR